MREKIEKSERKKQKKVKEEKKGEKRMKKGGVGSSNEMNQQPSGAESNSSQLRVRASSGTKNGLLSSSNPGQNGEYRYKTFDRMGDESTKASSQQSSRSMKSGQVEPSDVQVSPPDCSQELKLKKELGLMNGVSIIVGVIVGSGIFVSPKGVLLYTSSWGSALLVWICCGILSTLGALCYAELGTSIPRSGGDYAYIMEGFGPLPAFLFLWAAIIIIMPAGNAIAALTMANYILYNFFPGCEAPENATRFIAALAVCELFFPTFRPPLNEIHHFLSHSLPALVSQDSERIFSSAHSRRVRVQTFVSFFPIFSPMSPSFS